MKIFFPLEDSNVDARALVFIIGIVAVVGGCESGLFPESGQPGSSSRVSESQRARAAALQYAELQINGEIEKLKELVVRRQQDRIDFSGLQEKLSDPKESFIGPRISIQADSLVRSGSQGHLNVQFRKPDVNAMIERLPPEERGEFRRKIASGKRDLVRKSLSRLFDRFRKTQKQIPTAVEDRQIPVVKSSGRWQVVVTGPIVRRIEKKISSLEKRSTGASPGPTLQYALDLVPTLPQTRAFANSVINWRLERAQLQSQEKELRKAKKIFQQAKSEIPEMPQRRATARRIRRVERQFSYLNDIDLFARSVRVRPAGPKPYSMLFYEVEIENYGERTVEDIMIDVRLRISREGREKTKVIFGPRKSLSQVSARPLSISGKESGSFLMDATLGGEIEDRGSQIEPEDIEVIPYRVELR